jgi:hypothetical protein
MHWRTGQVAELQLVSGEEQVLIACPAEVVPSAGQYSLAAERGAIQATPLFLSKGWKQGFLAANPSPVSWKPGTALALYGPLGSGFHLPADVQRLALIGLGTTNSRLMSLLDSTGFSHASITLFSDAASRDLPPAVEAYPLEDLPEALTWADFFAVDAPLERLEMITPVFEEPEQGFNAIRGQIMVQAPMPCCGLGKCGVCALKVNRSWKLTCEDGPVFDLSAVLKGAR